MRKVPGGRGKMKTEGGCGRGELSKKELTNLKKEFGMHCKWKRNTGVCLKPSNGLAAQMGGLGKYW